METTPPKKKFKILRTIALFVLLVGGSLAYENRTLLRDFFLPDEYQKEVNLCAKNAKINAELFYCYMQVAEKIYPTHPKRAIELCIKGGDRIGMGELLMTLSREDMCRINIEMMENTTEKSEKGEVEKKEETKVGGKEESKGEEKEEPTPSTPVLRTQ